MLKHLALLGVLLKKRILKEAMMLKKDNRNLKTHQGWRLLIKKDRSLPKAKQPDQYIQM